MGELQKMPEFGIGKDFETSVTKLENDLRSIADGKNIVAGTKDKPIVNDSDQIPIDHFFMDDHDLYGNTWWHAINSWSYEWMHSNALYFDEVDSVIYVSNRNLSRISKISYPSGDVIWNMGLPSEYNTGDENICTDLLFSFQHHIQMLDDGDLLFFDNGNLSQMLLGDSNPISRIRRIRVIDDSYCETVWQYDLPQNLYGSAKGSVQFLENGNYFIYTLGNGLGEFEPSVFEGQKRQKSKFSDFHENFTRIVFLYEKFLMRSFWQNFQPQGVILGVKSQF